MWSSHTGFCSHHAGLEMTGCIEPVALNRSHQVQCPIASEWRPYIDAAKCKCNYDSSGVLVRVRAPHTIAQCQFGRRWFRAQWITSIYTGRPVHNQVQLHRNQCVAGGRWRRQLHRTAHTHAYGARLELLLAICRRHTPVVVVHVCTHGWQRIRVCVCACTRVCLSTRLDFESSRVAFLIWAIRDRAANSVCSLVTYCPRGWSCKTDWLAPWQSADSRMIVSRNGDNIQMWRTLRPERLPHVASIIIRNRVKWAYNTAEIIHVQIRLPGELYYSN